MVYYGQSGSSDDIIMLIEKFSHRKAQFVYHGKPLVSTFSGEVPGTFLVSPGSVLSIRDRLKT